MTRGRPEEDAGVAAVELALVLPVLLALILGAIDFGLAFRQQVMLHNAASSAASVLSIQPCDASGNGNSSGALAAAQQELSGVSALKPTPSVTLTYEDSASPPTVLTSSTACATAYQVRVLISAPYRLLTGSFLELFGAPGSFTVSGAETIRIQGR